jgi:hypothetical protein
VVKRGDSWAGVAIYRAAKKAISYQVFVEGGGNRTKEYCYGCFKRKHNFTFWAKVLSPKIRRVE